MADQSRQIKLAAAKKKLKEFQQKSSPASGGGGGNGGGPGAKKKKGGSQPDTPSADLHSPDNIQSILKVRSQTNGLALSPFGNSQNCTPDANGNENHVDENRPLSSTESLRQLSQQLNGLLSGSSTTYVNGDSAPSPANEKELESRNQELATALDSSNLTNSQLSTKLDLLTKQSQELTDQLQKERKEFELKCVREQGAMREQLQVHIQTIGILVSEKSELQTALSYTQQAARQKTGEAEELSNRLQATKQRVSELERTLSSVSTQQKQFDKHNKELERERDNLRLEVYRLNSVSEERRQQSSELSEQLKLRVSENSAMRLDLDELRKRLEMADVMLQQFSSQSGPPSANQQMQLLLEEKLQIEAHTAQLMESVAQLQTERDRYAEQIQEEGRVWKDKTEQLLSQVTLVAEERDRSISQIQELEAHITDLKHAAALLSHEREAQVDPQPSGPSESELALQEALSSLRQERDSLNTQFQAQLRDNEQLSRMCSEQESRLSELERHAERGAEDAEDRRRMLEDVQSDKATISRALAQNRTLKDQLAELQNGFVKLTNENMELTTALQSEHHVKKELGRRMGQLQEDLHNFKEQLELKSQEYQALLEQRDQIVAHLQQYSAGYTALASEREQLHRQYLQQSQLMDQLQHDETHGRVQLEMSHKQLEQYQERLERLSRDNEQLKAEVTELLNSSSLATPPRDQGDGVESQSLPESPQKSSIAIPEDFESREEMEEFVRDAVARVEAERDEVRSKLEEERRLHLAARRQAAAPSMEYQHHSHDHEHNHDHGHSHDHTHSHDDHSHCEHTVSGSEGVPVEVHEALCVAMEKLQHRFTSLMQEKADLKERVEELEHRCIQLSGETDTIGEYIALYQNQRAVMKQKHMEKEQYISMLAQDKEEMKAKLAELQDLVMRLVGERNEWYSRYAGVVASDDTTANPDLLPAEEDHVQAHHAHRRMELNAVDGQESMDLSKAVESDSSTPDTPHIAPSDLGQRLPPDSQALMRPQEDGTARQIMQLLQEIQGPRSVPFLGDNPCIPFFYRPDQQDEVKILVV
ncbi:golgin subfamily A member 2 isoform X3 [Salmo salar]|uniref:Golgin subfamily A member 2 isoform X3 n=1 Tax=Salmo salar TaxID=8030 RepID=A0A1S3LK59_SALSA|nr:golgin subfamily A member 2 isoform X3 [Salmo salar]|eukprot:XP_013991358.1 PREDICTED: golgin subfamily A member 2-like isoform X4 [Salmo salar]